MTGFLTQLFARGLGQANVARPRPVSRFEPLGPGDALPLAPAFPQADEGLEAADETVTRAAPRPAPRRARSASPTPRLVDEPTADEPGHAAFHPTPPAPPDAPRWDAPSPTVTPSAAPVPRVTAVVRDSSVSHANEAAVTPLPTLAPERAEAPTPTTTTAPLAASYAAPMPPSASAPSERVLVQPEIRPLVERSAPLSPAPPTLTPAPSGPTVHVTIGRLEVRATQPPPPSTAARRAEPQPPVKLDEYLRQRGGRGTP